MGLLLPNRDWDEGAIVAKGMQGKELGNKVQTAVFLPNERFFQNVNVSVTKEGHGNPRFSGIHTDYKQKVNSLGIPLCRKNVPSDYQAPAFQNWLAI